MIVDLFNFLWNAFFSLSGWQMVLWVMYLIYFVGRTYYYFDCAQDNGVIGGYKKVMFRNSNSIRLYHLFLIVWDMPMAVIGLFLPFLKKTLTFKVYEFKKDKPEEVQGVTKIK
jgi:hypothetical protein